MAESSNFNCNSVDSRSIKTAHFKLRNTNNADLVVARDFANQDLAHHNVAVIGYEPPSVSQNTHNNVHI